MDATGVLVGGGLAWPPLPGVEGSLLTASGGHSSLHSLWMSSRGDACSVMLLRLTHMVMTYAMPCGG